MGVVSFDDAVMDTGVMLESGMEFYDDGIDQAGLNAEGRREVSSAQKRSSRRETKEDRERLLGKVFHPSAITFLKEKLGLDVFDLKISRDAVEDLSKGFVAGPFRLRVTPFVYDCVGKSMVSSEPLEFNASLRVAFPFSLTEKRKDRVPQPIDVNVLPVYTFPVQRGLDPGVEQEELSSDVAQKSENPEVSAGPRFSEEEFRILQGLGVERETLFPSAGVARVCLEDRESMKSGDYFYVNGVISTDFGKSHKLNVSGWARYSIENGEVRKEFRAVPLPKKGEDLCPDFMTVRCRGNVEYDLVDKDGTLTQAGANLYRYGRSLGPVKGVSRMQEWDKESKSFRVVNKEGRYLLSMVNGGLCAERLERVDELNADGSPRMIKGRDGKAFQGYHYRVANVPEFTGDGIRQYYIDKDGKRRSKEVKFASPEDAELYLRGEGGVLRDALYWNAESRRLEKADLLAVPDSLRSGFPMVFGVAESEAILSERRELEQRKKHVESVRNDDFVPPRRKRNYSLGF